MIIGVTGPICSGTSLLMDLLAKAGFESFSYSDILRDELRKRNLQITRKALQDIGDELRKKEGLGVLSRKIIDKMERGKNYVVGNIRNPGEVEEFKKRFGDDFVLVKVDASFDVRFERARARMRENEPLGLEEFREMEKRDLGIEQSESGQQHQTVFGLAEQIVVNNGSIEELRQKAEMLLNDISKKYGKL